MRRIFVTLVMLMGLLVFAQSASFADNALRKFARGMTNACTGWMEIFTTVGRHCDENGYVAGVLFGLPAGLARTAWRMGVGIYEAVTFPIPLPAGYEPIMEPEFVFESALFE